MQLLSDSKTQQGACKPFINTFDHAAQHADNSLFTRGPVCSSFGMDKFPHGLRCAVPGAPHEKGLLDRVEQQEGSLQDGQWGHGAGPPPCARQLRCDKTGGYYWWGPNFVW